MHHPEPAEGAVDRPTLIAMAIVAYALANVAHEGLGHGGACLVTGGRPVALSAVYFDCDETALAGAAVQAIAAAGTLVNFCLAAASLAVLRARRLQATPVRYFFWLLMAVNLLQGTGYWLFSGLLDVGDWAAVIRGITPPWIGRAVLALMGGAGYWGAIKLSLRELVPFVGQGPARIGRARSLSLVPYLTGGLLYVLAGLPNPLGWHLVVISAAAASFGGTSAMAWMTAMLGDAQAFPPSANAALSLRRSTAWLAAGAVAAAVFVAVLGPAVRL